jgi:hypothetical protein
VGFSNYKVPHDILPVNMGERIPITSGSVEYGTHARKAAAPKSPSFILPILICHCTPLLSVLSIIFSKYLGLGLQGGWHQKL